MGRAVRWSVPLLLVVAAVLMVLAEVQRWGAVCGWGDFDSPLCVGRQSHEYDYLLPGSGWVPTGASAAWGSAALGVYALALLLVPFALLRVVRPLAILAGLVLAVPLATLAVSTGWAARLGEPSPFDSTGWGALAELGSVTAWVLVLPGVLLALAFSRLPSTEVEPGTSGLAPALVAASSLSLGSPVLLYVLSSWFYLSHDTVPWTNALGALLQVVAAAAFVILLRAERRHTRPDPARPQVLEHTR